MSSGDEEEETCPICFDGLNKVSKCQVKKKTVFNEVKELVVTLDCRHKFHYECIAEWFKQKKMKHPYSSSGKSIRVCPYCIEKTGYLELPKNTFPIKFIHNEYSKIEECINVGDQSKILEICKPYFNPKYCLCVLKSRASKGQQCRKYKTNESNYCSIHKKKYDLNESKPSLLKSEIYINCI